MYKNISDINCWFGTNHLLPEISVNRNDLLNFYEYLRTLATSPNIVVSNYWSLHYDPIEGDNEVKKLLLENDFLKGCLIFPNFYIDRENDFESYLQGGFKSGFRFIRLYPKTHKYLISCWAFKKIYEILDEHTFPVIINIDELDITSNKAIDWDLIKEIADSFPQIPLIIDGGNSKELMFSGYFYQLLRNCSNIYLESHNLLAFNQIENIAERFGASRILLGSNFAVYPQHLSVERICYCRLPEEDRKKILSENADLIINNIRF